MMTRKRYPSSSRIYRCTIRDCPRCHNQGYVRFYGSPWNLVHVDNGPELMLGDPTHPST